MKWRSLTRRRRLAYISSGSIAIYLILNAVLTVPGWSTQDAGPESDRSAVALTWNITASLLTSYTEFAFDNGQ